MSKTGTDLEAMRLAVLNSLRKNQSPATESQMATGESTPTAPAPAPSTSEQNTNDNAPEGKELNCVMRVLLLTWFYFRSGENGAAS